MMASRSEVWLVCPEQAELAWLVRQGVPTTALVRPTAIMLATGSKTHDGLFEHAEHGERWIAFEQEDDFVFWHAGRNAFATYSNRAFALGEEAIDNPGTYAFERALNIFASPLDWLRAGRDGIVVLDWSWAFDRLRDAPRIAIAEGLLPLYKRHMRPARMPELFVISRNRQAA
ncbi:hypothetical protein [Mesorhizobium sp. KR2-14]|uniref:hypothetical protein n=1 Tax=Mesorhizobium sp. KR2-14 TaxID=3156610 RepID=UPI0032B48BED